MLLERVVETSATVAETRSRRAKIDALSALLMRLDAAEVEPVVSWLSGELVQGRVGIGYRTLSGLRIPASRTPTLTVAMLDDLFDRLAATAGAGSAAARRELLSEMFDRATTAEQRFLVQLLGGELRQGALEGVMTDAVARAAGLPAEPVRRAFMLSGRLPHAAAAALQGGLGALAEFRLELGRPVRPMLAAPAESLRSAVDELGEVSVEYKLDGARIQVHRDNERVWVFTRTLRDITASVPELVQLLAGLPCRSVVLDGETLALTDAGRPRPFQETMSRFGARSERELLLHPYFFDCVHLDGEDLLDRPLSERLSALERVAPGHRVPAVIRPDADTAGAHLDASLEHGHEGVMVKQLASPYIAGRRGRAWQKVKPEHTVDLVVLGAEWGYGRRRGFLSNLHLGARDPDGGPPIMVGKTFKGLTDALLRWQTEEFPKHESHRDEHTVYLRAELVVEIELDGVQTSTRYPGGVALRFARILRYRPDKSAAEADTIDAVRALLPGGGLHTPVPDQGLP
ncbi:ATP-dependent DNA ligase [Rhodococcus chondri]|uniref:DNA ligase n=1 Tax=Rhodococcus chondri TaxID=3065941 RepID=A0ABU7JX78_9NOCA|nr:ATP-dependent DNA ligase [Rhodococcus sp. CC-R104]MEE2034626.1 ATP-dependent DNA ligase [Rhodococcus sp. CC-R104]